MPLRATVSSFGPTLLSKVLGLNDTQESSLGLVFHYADKAGLKSLGGLATSTAGAILRELIAFSDRGADDGRGVISLVELPRLQDRPAVFSTFLMWLLADLFSDLPEVGDVDTPKLVFFFDEAHLLFKDASRAFLDAIAQTVRLIRSKGVGVFFVTQCPTDVPDEVLAQLGSRVQHQLRAHTPNDLGEVITSLGIGEAVVTVMNERGAPTPVAWTMLRAPESRMNPADRDVLEGTVAASALHGKYAEQLDRDSAHEMLARKLEAGAEAEAARDGPRERLRRSPHPRRRSRAAWSTSS